MTTRIDLARDALYESMADIIAAYHLKIKGEDIEGNEHVEAYIEACLDALPVLLTPFNVDPIEDIHGNRW